MTLQIEDKTFEPFIEYNLIEKRIRLMAIQMTVDYEDKAPVFIGVLNGAFIFMADLIREIETPVETAFVKVASYNGATTSSGTIKDELELNIDIIDRHIVIVEDIVETGLTLQYLIEKFKEKNPASISVAALLYKPKALKADIEEIEYIGFEIPNDFVVGFGMDYKGFGRNTCDIYRLCE